MNKIYKQTPLYRFLEYCNYEKTLESPKILDCGAGGSEPPLMLFHAHGYETYGVELDQGQIDKANQCLNLNIIKGDMTQLEFKDATFDFVYSYNSIFHMKKVEIKKALGELKRVLKPGGLLFVNMLSVDDSRCGQGPHLGENQYEQMDDEPVIHSYFEYDEADCEFSDMTFVLKERRIIERIFEGERIKQGFIDYIMRKSD